MKVVLDFGNSQESITWEMVSDSWKETYTTPDGRNFYNGDVSTERVTTAIEKARLGLTVFA
jgi:hypothetical protein